MGVSHSHEDTIVATASPHGSGIRGIVRLSGPNAIECAAVSFQPDPGERTPDSLTIADATTGQLNCDGLAVPGRMLVWPTESSFTRQPSVEFHTFGTGPVLDIVVQQFCRHGARAAEPGEFTMRAFLSGRLDLTQAEAVLAVIDAKNRKQLDVAIDQLAGGLGSRLDETRDELVAALAELEAGLDFVEEDIEFITNDEMVEKLNSALESISNLLEQLSGRDRQNQSFKVGLFGLPNAGKSSLFNCLLGKDLAIVSNLQGTTTDSVTSSCKINGQQIELVDTAGLESIEADQSIAAAAQRHRSNEIEHCDLALLCINAASDQNEFESQLRQLSEFNAIPRAIVLTQTDCVESPESAIELANSIAPSEQLIPLSVVQERGIDALKEVIRQAALESQSSESAIVGSTMLRTGQSLQEAHTAIESAFAAASEGIGDEVVASEVRSALDCLGLIVGTVYTDDILDVVFGKFCIGK